MSEPETNEELLENDTSLLLDDDDLFVRAPKKHKILMISDHPLFPSGVGVQARVLIDGLIKTGRYTFRCLGAAIKHQDYRTVKVSDDLLIKPIDGFGNPTILRQLLLEEQPDAILIFTDPRQFTWLWQMEDEIHQICPITYWHVWDNDPYPKFNGPWYESTDLINCISKKTYDLVVEHFPEKTNYIPHAFPKEIYHPLDPSELKEMASKHFPGKEDWFKALWVNRNAMRKVPNDVLESWKMFLDELEQTEGHRNALLIMHTDPFDQEGPNLVAVTELLGLQDNVIFSNSKLEFKEMNMLHNLCDVCINISKNEGYGLSTHINMQVGKPVIALKTGGEYKVQNPVTGQQYGVALEPVKRLLVGSQTVPYIYEDYADQAEVKDAFMKIYKMTDEEKQKLSEDAIAYIDENFSCDSVVKAWDESLEKCIVTFKESKGKSKFVLETLNVEGKPALSLTPAQIQKMINDKMAMDQNKKTAAPTLNRKQRRMNRKKSGTKQQQQVVKPEKQRSIKTIDVSNMDF